MKTEQNTKPEECLRSSYAIQRPFRVGGIQLPQNVTEVGGRLAKRGDARFPNNHRTDSHSMHVFAVLDQPHLESGLQRLIVKEGAQNLNIVHFRNLLHFAVAGGAFLGRGLIEQHRLAFDFTS